MSHNSHSLYGASPPSLPGGFRTRTVWDGQMSPRAMSAVWPGNQYPGAVPPYPMAFPQSPRGMYHHAPMPYPMPQQQMYQQFPAHYQHQAPISYPPQQVFHRPGSSGTPQQFQHVHQYAPPQAVQHGIPPQLAPPPQQLAPSQQAPQQLPPPQQLAPTQYVSQAPQASGSLNSYNIPVSAVSSDVPPRVLAPLAPASPPADGCLPLDGLRLQLARLERGLTDANRQIEIMRENEKLAIHQIDRLQKQLEDKDKLAEELSKELKNHRKSGGRRSTIIPVALARAAPKLEMCKRGDMFEILKIVQNTNSAQTGPLPSSDELVILKNKFEALGKINNSLRAENKQLFDKVRGVNDSEAEAKTKALQVKIDEKDEELRIAQEKIFKLQSEQTAKVLGSGSAADSCSATGSISVPLESSKKTWSLKKEDELIKDMENTSVNKLMKNMPVSPISDRVGEFSPVKTPFSGRKTRKNRPSIVSPLVEKLTSETILSTFDEMGGNSLDKESAIEFAAKFLPHPIPKVISAKVSVKLFFLEFFRYFER